jgi:hypothetical protein
MVLWVVVASAGWAVAVELEPATSSSYRLGDLEIQRTRFEDQACLVSASLGGLELVGWVDYARQQLMLQVVEAGGGGRPQALGLAERERLRAGLEQADSAEPVLDRTSRLVLEAVSGYPAGSTIDFDSSRAEIPYVSLCDALGSTVAGRYDAGFGPRSSAEALGPCDDGVCFGRCGEDCLRIGRIPQQYPQVQIYTQECFNLDLCERDPSGNSLTCIEEYEQALPSHFFAPNCIIAGDWEWQREIRTVFLGVQGETCDVLPRDIFSNDIFFKNALVNFDGRIDNFHGHYLEENVVGRNYLVAENRIPLYMGEECDFRFAGYGRVFLFGKQDRCGGIRLKADAGTWPYYDRIACVPVGDGLVTRAIYRGKRGTLTCPSAAAAAADSRIGPARPN